MNQCNLLSSRRAGILLHPTSLPGPFELGDFSYNANKFVDFLADINISAWQVLPLGPTHSDLSPYGAYSAHAGNPNLISLEKLTARGWLDKESISRHANHSQDLKALCLRDAYYCFISNAKHEDHQLFEAFKIQQKNWLNDFAMFVCLRQHFNNLCWNQWPLEFRDRDNDNLTEFSLQFKTELDLQKFIQYVFFLQWTELKSYANERNIILIGDIPIFVGLDSADVWAHRDYFSIDQFGNPVYVAGVPPDYFSETGQRWGNPHYQWDNLQRDDFSWWIERIKTQHALFDAIRIDHFRGLVQYWEIPAEESTAQGGRWVPAPGKALLESIRHHFPDTCIIAEDLGIITHDVEQLRDEFNLPGMRILQFAFDGSNDNPHLPSNYTENSIAYTATHDNNITIGWYNSLTEDTKQFVHEIINYSELPMPWPLIHTVLSSVSNTAIIPMQDLLELDETCRMNIPGTINDQNWRWRFEWDQIKTNKKEYMANLIETYNRTYKQA